MWPERSAEDNDGERPLSVVHTFAYSWESIYRNAGVLIVTERKVQILGDCQHSQDL